MSPDYTSLDSLSAEAAAANPHRLLAAVAKACPGPEALNFDGTYQGAMLDKRIQEKLRAVAATFFGRPEREFVAFDSALQAAALTRARDYEIKHGVTADDIPVVPIFDMMPDNLILLAKKKFEMPQEQKDSHAAWLPYIIQSTVRYAMAEAHTGTIRDTIHDILADEANDESALFEPGPEFTMEDELVKLIYGRVKEVYPNVKEPDPYDVRVMEDNFINVCAGLQVFDEAAVKKQPAPAPQSIPVQFVPEEGGETASEPEEEDEFADYTALNAMTAAGIVDDPRDFIIELTTLCPLHSRKIDLDGAPYGADFVSRHIRTKIREIAEFFEGRSIDDFLEFEEKLEYISTLIFEDYVEKNGLDILNLEFESEDTLAASLQAILPLMVQRGVRHEICKCRSGELRRILSQRSYAISHEFNLAGSELHEADVPDGPGRQTYCATADLYSDMVMGVVPPGPWSEVLNGDEFLQYALTTGFLTGELSSPEGMDFGGAPDQPVGPAP